MRPRLRLGPVALVLVISGAPACTVGLRAQVTEVPQTMAPGQVLIRMDAISFGLAPDAAAPNQHEVMALGTTLISAGIAKTVDLEVGAQLFLRDTVSISGTDQTHSGIGAVTLQPKWTFWSDSATGQEAAIIPYVTLPTHSDIVGNNAVQGGIILPWSMDLAAGTKAGAMFEWDELRNLANTRYDTRWYGSAYLKWSPGQLLSVYTETTLSDSTAGSSSFVGTVGGGATLSVSNNFQWDFEESKVLGPGRNSWAEVLRFRWKLP